MRTLVIVLSALAIAGSAGLVCIGLLLGLPFRESLALIPRALLMVVCIVVGTSPWWAVMGGIGAAIGSSRGSARNGFALGLFLGPIGWIIAAVSDWRPPCPECRGHVDVGARRCPHCGVVYATRAAVSPDDWQDQTVELSPQRAAWAAKTGTKMPAPPRPSPCQARVVCDFDAAIAADLAGETKPHAEPRRRGEGLR